MIKLENSIQAHKTIQNLKFNTETKLVRGARGLPGLGRPAPLPLAQRLPSSPAGTQQPCPEMRAPGLAAPIPMVSPTVLGSSFVLPPWLLGNTRGPCVLQRTEEIATLRESVLRLWSEEGPWPLTLGSRRVLMSLVRQRFFIKDVAPGELVSVNCWGVYQTVRWAAGSPAAAQAPGPG